MMMGITSDATAGRWAALMAILLLGAAVVGCQSKLFSYEGALATQKDNIPLQPGGPHQGKWQSDDVIVHYTYGQGADKLQIEGTVELTQRLKSFRMVKNFSLRANFLDEDRRILKSVGILVAGNTPINPWLFSAGIPLPAGVKALNFSYSGAVREGTSSRAIDVSFWKSP